MLTRIVSMALIGVIPTAPPQAPEADGPKAVSAAFDAAFNAADAEAVAALFAEQAELVDEAGNVYVGREEIAEVLKALFERFPGLGLSREVEQLRLVGPSLAIEDGVTTLTSHEEGSARNRYLAVLVKADDGWRIASIRQAAEEPIPTARQWLEPLAWLVGEWVSEGGEQAVSLSFRWDEGENFLIGGYTIEQEGQAAIRTDQRIGYDAAHRFIRSWNFDSDGGFSEARWSTDGSAWVVKSDLVLPDGLTGSATFYLAPVDEDRFIWSSLDRVIGGVVQPNVEVTIVRKPPAPGH